MKILHHGLWQQQKFAKQIQQRKNNLLTAIFKRTTGIYTHIDDIVSRDKQEFVIWRFYYYRRNMR